MNIFDARGIIEDMIGDMDSIMDIFPDDIEFGLTDVRSELSELLDDIIDLINDEYE